MKLTKTGLPQGYTKYDAFVWYNPGETNHAGIYVKQSLQAYFTGYEGFTNPVKNYTHIPFIQSKSAEGAIRLRLGSGYNTINFIKKEREETENETAA